MSKSIGNIVNVTELLKKWDPEVVRFFYSQAHYRSPPDFSEKALKNAEKGLTRIYRLKEKLEELSDNKKIDKTKLNKDETNYLKTIDDFKSDFESAMDDDFNTPLAVSAIFEFVNKSNSFLEKNTTPDKNLCSYALDTLIKLGNVLTLFQAVSKETDDKELSEKLRQILKSYKKVDVKGVEKSINLLLEIREEARKKKDWNKADKIRKELDEIGIEVQDTTSGPAWRKK
jgi:cysteinyl-tRNA synthetase